MVGADEEWWARRDTPPSGRAECSEGVSVRVCVCEHKTPELSVESHVLMTLSPGVIDCHV